MCTRRGGGGCAQGVDVYPRSAIFVSSRQRFYRSNIHPKIKYYVLRAKAIEHVQ